MTQKFRVIFIHGNETIRWSYLWTPWLKEELEKLGLDVIFETFPDSIMARKEYWLEFLGKDYLKADEHTLLIGHSSGATAAMKFAEENTIFGSILISPSYTDLGLESERVSGWYDDPWNWDKIRKNQKFIGLFYSKNDEIIPLQEFLEIQEKIKPDEVRAFETNGHFIKQRTFPEVVASVSQLLEDKNSE
ncbi:retinoblastoma-binding protein 9 [Candidatus Woesearchaeota archaeon]|nr:retinoblastoma-binding protein 9 [Candidatus Woesearchaeota archaeon]